MVLLANNLNRTKITFLWSYNTVVILPLALTINRGLIQNSTPIRRIDRADVKTQKSLKSSTKLVIILLLRA